MAQFNEILEVRRICREELDEEGRTIDTFEVKIDEVNSIVQVNLNLHNYWGSLGYDKEFEEKVDKYYPDVDVHEFYLQMLEVIDRSR